MGVVEAKIQTVEDIYRLVWTAVATKQPISAMYKGLPRLFCPHRLGRNRAKQLRVLCYQCGGGRANGPAPVRPPPNCGLSDHETSVEGTCMPGCGRTDSY